jgi:3-oxoacyl-[acyl-carrier protein] reductase
LAESGHRVIGLARTAPVDFPGRAVAVDLADAAATQAAMQILTAEEAITAVIKNVGLIVRRSLATSPRTS